MEIDYGNFKYEVDTKEMCNALAKIACEQFYGDNGKNEEIIKSTAKFIYHADLEESLYESYKDEIKEFFRDRAENWYDECREQWLDDRGLINKF